MQDEVCRCRQTAMTSLQWLLTSLAHLSAAGDNSDQGDTASSAAVVKASVFVKDFVDAFSSGLRNGVAGHATQLRRHAGTCGET